MRKFVTVLSLVWLAGFLTVGPVAAQNSGQPPLGFAKDFPSGAFGASPTTPGQELIVTAEFKIRTGTDAGILAVTATPAAGWYTYSVTQRAGGGLPSKLVVATSADYQVDASWKPSQPPTILNDPNFEVPLEEHKQAVTWSTPLRLSPGVDPQSLKIPVTYSGQVCAEAGQCIPINNRRVTASFAGYFGAPPVDATSASAAEPGSANASVEYRADRSNVVIKGHVEPRAVAPGDKVKLVLTAVPDHPYHVYRLADTEIKDAIAKPTLIVLSNALGWSASPPKASKSIVDDPTNLAYYEGDVSWTIEWEVPKDTVAGEYPLEGVIGYQVCIKDSLCDPPRAATFSAAVTVAEAQQPGRMPLAFSKASYNSVAQAAEQAAVASALTGGSAEPSSGTSFSALLVAAALLLTFLASLVLTGAVPQLSGLPANLLGMALLLVVALVAAALHELDKAQTEPTLWTMLAIAFAAWLIAHIPAKAGVAKRVLTVTAALGIVALIGASFFIGKEAVPVCALVGGGAFAIWVVMKIPSGATLLRKVFGFATATVGLTIALGIAWIALQTTELPWEDYSPEALQKHRASGNIVLVDFTADW